MNGRPEEKRKKFARDLLGTEFDDSVRREIVERILESRPGKGSAEAESRPGQGSPKPPRSLRPGEICYPSTCFSCHNTCECLVYCDSATGRVLRVEGDPDSPQTHGRLCVKGLSAANLCHNRERLLHPLKRVGERGEGKFQEISWDEALDITAKKLLEYRSRYGPQCVAFLEGTRRGWSRVFSRLANCFGAPNHGAAGWAQCLWPRLVDCNATFGKGMNYPEVYDFKNTDCILCWGINPPVTWASRAGDIMDARQRGAALIVVDPFLSETAAKADIWLQLRPDTDTALALAMLHIIIEEGLQDQSFIDAYTSGYDQLKESVKPYTARWGQEITGMEADLIRKAARLYAKAGSASLVRCLAVDQVHDSFQASRALSCLIAVTGSIGRPGTNNLPSNRGEVSQNTLDFIRFDRISPDVQKLRCGYEEFPLLTQELSPVPCAHMPSLWEQVISGKPYPIPCALIFGSNAVVNYTNSARVAQAVGQFEFLAVCDLFMTPTARMADIVFPASSWLERDNVISSFQSDNTHTLFQQKITQVGESLNDVDIICRLARRLGLEEDFWTDSEGLYDALLAPTGRTFRQALKERRLYAPMEYGQHKKKPFKTPSGRIELYATLAEEKGCDPLPRYTPPFQSPETTPELAAAFPLIMTTGRHESAFRHTENRNNPYLLELTPLPWLDIHPQTARKLGIADGQKVLVESTANEAYAYARYTLGLRPDVVQGIAGWQQEFNINRTVPWGQYAAGIGTVCARGYLCRVTPVEE